MATHNNPLTLQSLMSAALSQLVAGNQAAFEHSCAASASVANNAQETLRQLQVQTKETLAELHNTTKDVTTKMLDAITQEHKDLMAITGRAKVSIHLPRPKAQVPRVPPRSAAKGRAQRMAAPSEGPPGSEVSIFLDGGVEAMRAEGHRRAHAHAPLRSRNGNVVGASPAGALSALLAEVRLAPTTAKAVATLPGYIELEDFLEADKVELEEIIAKTGMERPEARRFLKAIAAKKKSV